MTPEQVVRTLNLPTDQKTADGKLLKEHPAVVNIASMHSDPKGAINWQNLIQAFLQLLPVILAIFGKPTPPPPTPTPSPTPTPAK